MTDLDNCEPELWDDAGEFAYLFDLDDMHLDKTSLVKHTIKETDPVPFKARYRRIHPSQFEQVRKH